MVLWSVLGKPGLGFPSSRFRSPGAPKLLSLGLLWKNMGFRFLWPADATRPELVFPLWHQLRGMGCLLYTSPSPRD
eukprot:13957377-Alexandrium_andersonii.AAC.1